MKGEAMKQAGALGVIEVRDVVYLKPNPLNPRGELREDDPRIQSLAASIKEKGLIEPLIITPDGIVVAGHRRLLALKIAGVLRARVIVQRLSEVEQLEIMLVENLQREDLTPIEEANAYRQLIEQYQTTINDVSRRTSVTHAHIQLRLALLRLAPNTQLLFNNHDMQVTAVQHLLKITDPERQQKLGMAVLERRMTVKKLADLIEREAGEINKRESSEKAQKWNQGVPRQEALELLSSNTNRQVSFSDLSRLFKETCCACGMTGTEKVCLACPLPQFVKSIAVGLEAR